METKDVIKELRDILKAIRNDQFDSEKIRLMLSVYDRLLRAMEIHLKQSSNQQDDEQLIGIM